MKLFFNLLCGSFLISISFASISSFEFGLLLKDSKKSREFLSLGEVFFSNPESGDHFEVLLGRSVSNAFQSRMQSDSELTCKIEGKLRSRLSTRETRYFLSGDVLFLSEYLQQHLFDGRIKESEETVDRITFHEYPILNSYREYIGSSKQTIKISFCDYTPFLKYGNGPICQYTVKPGQSYDSFSTSNDSTDDVTLTEPFISHKNVKCLDEEGCCYLCIIS